MLATQVQYWNLQEAKRHNKAFETETFRHNTATELIAANTLTEQTRHNKQTERISWNNLDYQYAALNETMRHNKASERLQSSNIALGYANLAEAQRSHRAQESISDYNSQTQRILGIESNKISAQNAKTGMINASINQQNANTNAYNAETNRQHVIADSVLRVGELGSKFINTISNAFR